MSMFASSLGYHTWNEEKRLAGPVAESAPIIFGLLSIASIAASAYHGSKRHGGSIGWGIGWGIMGGLFPILTPAIGAGQGFAACRYNCKR